MRRVALVAVFLAGLFAAAQSMGSSSSSMSNDMSMMGAPFHALVFTASLSSANESPDEASNSPGHGTAEAVLIGHLLIISGTYSGFNSAVDPKILGGSHIHLGALGQSGPIIFILHNTGGKSGSFFGVFYLTDEQIKEAMADMFYVNLHTYNHPMGAIRGQLLLEGAANMGGM